MTRHPLSDEVLRMVFAFNSSDSRCDAVRDLADRIDAALAISDIPSRMATLATKVLDRLRSTDGYTTVGSMYDEDFAGDVAQLRQAIEDFNNE